MLQQVLLSLVGFHHQMLQYPGGRLFGDVSQPCLQVLPPLLFQDCDQIANTHGVCLLQCQILH